MPRPKLDLDPWMNAINVRMAEGQTQSQIREWLQSQGVQISRSTLQANLRLWGTHAESYLLSQQLSDESLIESIYRLWCQNDYTNKMISDHLSALGTSISIPQVQRIRWKQKWHRRNV